MEKLEWGVITCKDGEARKTSLVGPNQMPPTTQEMGLQPGFCHILSSLFLVGSSWNQKPLQVKRVKPSRWGKVKWDQVFLGGRTSHVSFLNVQNNPQCITQFCRRNSSSYQLHTSSNLFWAERLANELEFWPALCPAVNDVSCPGAGGPLPTPIFPLSQLTQHTAARGPLGKTSIEGQYQKALITNTLFPAIKLRSISLVFTILQHLTPP